MNEALIGLVGLVAGAVLPRLVDAVFAAKRAGLDEQTGLRKELREEAHQERLGRIAAERREAIWRQAYYDCLAGKRASVPDEDDAGGRASGATA